MAIIKKVGPPTRLTEGSIGDTYIDLKTKKSYNCTAAYKASTGNVDYTWREGALVDEIEVESEKTPDVSPIPEPEVSVKEDAEEPNGPEVKENAKKPKHNYNKQYKKN